ncbi:MAG TPA: exodeoxyribonuclease VII large subunit [Terriglobia bacterium]|nr:exodeoxyribonuclease VII large subunit [Terriglobia bacterium]
MNQIALDFKPQRRIYTVSEISEEIRAVFEDQFPDVWIAGEISNFRAAGSGHCYFTLKDAKAQLRAVCFRSQARYLKFKPADGLSVIARGQLSVYEARGEYQLIVELLEPAGLGALQLAFDQLKARLAAEGLFDSSRKRQLPALPRTVGIVTSPTGAVIRDILRVLHRRFRNINALLYPARVQGEDAAREIVEGIRCLNRWPGVDVLIVARGGGSLEDLWAFNEEIVARAIVASRVPVVSAVGHETDFTIADFVADLRAPTPSAAAELVVRPRQDFEAEVASRARHLLQCVRLNLAGARHQLQGLGAHRVFQTLATRVVQRAQRVDEAAAALQAAMARRLSTARDRFLRLAPGVIRYDFDRFLDVRRGTVRECAGCLETALDRILSERRNRWAHERALLAERNPLAILRRGYSITRDAAGRIVRDASRVAAGSEVSIRLASGELSAEVKAVKPQA